VITAHFTKRPTLELFTCGASLDLASVPLQLRGEPGGVHRIEWSADLAHWSPLATVTNVFGTVQFNDTAGGPHRFYRTRTGP
jgi:hypothetical protein